MLTIGDRFPSFKATAVTTSDITTAFTEVTEKTAEGQWQVYFFYPKDFTFICPTELVGFDQLNNDFKSRNAKIYGASVDSEFVHLAWRKDHHDLNNLSYPLIADVRRDLSTALGIIHPDEGVTTRSTFIVDPQGTIRYAASHDLSVGRSPAEILRVLEALQSDELCGCDWTPGEDYVQAA